MTKNADFKKLVRARMAKTGESYAAARAQLVDAPAPTVEEYADLAGIADERVLEKTGRDWQEWVAALDPLGAADLDHTAIAKLVRENWPEVGGWWAQSITVSYERIRGLRQKGQTCTGSWACSKSKTFAVPVEELFGAFVDDDVRGQWLGEEVELRAVTAPKRLRFDLSDGSVVAVNFTDKGAKSSVSLQNDKLGSEEGRDAAKEAWSERFERLATALTP